MAPAMSSRIAIREIGFTLILLLVSFAQAVDYELHRHDEISVNSNDNIILTSRDFLEQLNFVAPKESYTLQEATEHLLYFGALLRARIVDTFGSLLYDYYDDFSVAEVEALHKIYGKILERQYDVFDLIPSVLRNQDTRPSRICTEIYKHSRDSCLRSSASICRRIRKQHDLPHPDDHNTAAMNVTYHVYYSSKISKQYPRGFSLATLLRLLQREVLVITPNLLSGLVYNVRYENYDDDVRLVERELIQHFREISKVSEISVSTVELRKFHTMNSFLKYYIGIYAEKSSDNDLKKYAVLIAKRITDDVGTIDENIHLLGNVYEDHAIHVEYLFDLVLPDDLLEKDLIEAKKYLVMKLNKFNVVEKYLKVEKYQQVTPAQLLMEITGQLIDIDFAKNIATSLRMHAKFWHKSRMIESLDELLELFDAYENLRQVPRYVHIMEKIDEIKESLQNMKDVPVEILCSVPRACLRIGLKLILRCKLINSQIKDSIKNFLEMSDECVDTPMDLRRSVEIPFKISKNRFSTTLLTTGQTGETTIRRSTAYRKFKATTEPVEFTKTTTEIPRRPKDQASDFPRTTMTTVLTTTEPMPTSTMAITSTTVPTTTPLPIITTLPTTTTTLSTTTTMLPTITTLPTTTTTLPTTTTTMPTTITTLPTTTTEVPTTTTTLPTTTTAVPTTTTEVPTTTTAVPTTTTEVPTTTTTLPTTTTAVPTTTTEVPTTTTEVPTTTTEVPTTTTTLPTTTTAVPTTTTEVPTTTTTLPTTTTAVPTTTTEVPTTTTTLPTTTTEVPTTTTTLSTTTTTLPTTTTTTLPTTISTTLPTTAPTTHAMTTTTILPTTEVSIVDTNVVIALNRSKIMTQVFTPHVDIGISTKTLITAVPTRPCEAAECITEQSTTSKYVETTPTLLSTTQSPTTMPTMQTSTLETTEPPHYQDLTTDSTVFSTTELIETPTTKGCAQICLEKCEFNVETSGRSCETSCDSVTEDCNEDNPTETSSQECDKSCECDTNEKSGECMTLCPPDQAESSSCENGECMTARVPPLNIKVERSRIRGIMCEIPNPHHRRQLRRMAKMRAISASAGTATSHVDISRSRTSHRRDQIAIKKLRKTVDIEIPYSKSKKVTEYLQKKPLHGRLSGNDREQRRRKEQIYRLKKRLTRKLSGGLSRKTTMHHTRGIVDQFRHSQIKRISERGAKLIDA